MERELWADDLPQWISIPQHHTSAGEITLSRGFECEDAVNQARLKMAADFASCSVVLNGQAVVTVDDFGPLIDIDVAPHLKRGSNTIQLVVRRSAGPSAVAFQLQIIGDNKPSESIVSDSAWRARDSNDQDRGPVVTQGNVSPQFWIHDAGNRITAFDDYTQWKQAETGSDLGANPAGVTTLPGFEIEVVYKAGPSDGSWVSMAFDPQGRITIAREDQGLLRLTLATDDDPQTLETINDSLKECRGLLYAHGSLYANANNSKGLYRLSDTDSDDQFDEVTLMREFPGGVGHGRNDLALGPDGLIYSIHGDAVDVPDNDIRDFTSPFRDFGMRAPVRQGHLVRTDKDGEQWDLVATGLRNPFGIHFNEYGDVFTYDADAEFDMGAPWYRPTRVDHLVSGADFGWRGLTGQWPPYQLDHADNALPTATIGKGSPTAVKFGTASSFSASWRSALFILDWAYGRIVACHLFPRGAGYVCRSETFLKGRPLNVTDLDFGPDGAMYFVTGGRKTESSLYRLRWVGTPINEAVHRGHRIERDNWSAAQRTARHHLEEFHVAATAEDSVAEIWPYLASPDPSIRQAAQVALEHQPVAEWRERALTESDPAIAAVALLSLTRGTDPLERSEILVALNRVPTSSLSAFDKLTVLRACSLALDDASVLDAAILRDTTNRITSWLSEETASTQARVAPTGAGGSVVANLCRIVMRLTPDVANQDVLRKLRESVDDEDRIFNLFLLRDSTSGWQLVDRRLYFEILNDVGQTVLGGDGMPGFLSNIRKAAVASLSDSEQEALTAVIEAPENRNIDVLSITRPHVRDWTLQNLPELLSVVKQKPGNTERGQQLFNDTLCSRCHRIGNRGGVVGPDLTSVGSRFSHRDILKSLLDPSDVVAEKYRDTTVVTRDGKTVTGRVLSSGDYRSPTLRIATDPLDASKVVEIPKSEVEVHKASRISPMPKGLMSTLTATEITDLVAYLVSASRRLK
jgi:putative heme-binding domain-containing protein